MLVGAVASFVTWAFGLRPKERTTEANEIVGAVAALVTVEIGREIRERAGPDEVLASHTVRDLVAGSGLDFEERGAETFANIHGRWRLYRVVRGV